MADEQEVEWELQDRWKMQETYSGLFLGPYAVAAKCQFYATTSQIRDKMNNIGLQLAALKAAGITHIVCVRQDMEAKFIKPNFMDHFCYLVLAIRDEATQNIIQFFSKVNSFIINALQAGGKVLVHGNIGTSRSAALVIAFLMWRTHRTFMEAYRYLQTKRFCLLLNPGFIAQLEEYEKILMAEREMSMSDSNPRLQPAKRKFENDDTVEGLESQKKHQQDTTDMDF